MQESGIRTNSRLRRKCMRGGVGKAQDGILAALSCALDGRPGRRLGLESDPLCDEGTSCLQILGISDAWPADPDMMKRCS